MLPCSSLPSVARPKRSPGKYTAGSGKRVPFGPAGVSVISLLEIARLFLASVVGPVLNEQDSVSAPVQRHPT